MSMHGKLVAVVLVGLSFLTGSGLTEEDDPYLALPIVRVVLPTRHIPEDKRWLIYGLKLKYDDEFRRPDVPPERVPVDCAKTQLIGVYYILRRQLYLKDGAPTTRNIWTHTSIVSNDRALNHQHGVSFRHGERRAIAGEFLRLTREWKTDGVWTLEVRIGSETLFRDSFELSGCERINGSG